MSLPLSDTTRTTMECQTAAEAAYQRPVTDMVQHMAQQLADPNRTYTLAERIAQWREQAAQSKAEAESQRQSVHDALYLDGRAFAFERCADEAELVRESRDVTPVLPTIICLCGSTRFVDTWMETYQRLSDDGNIVLTVARMPPRPNLQRDEPELKARLDALHLRKIDLANEVLILNVGGYIGESTRREIAYAKSHGKTVRYLEDVAEGRTR